MSPLRFLGGDCNIEKFKNISKLSPIFDFDNDEIILKNGKRIIVLNVEPINYKLKSKSEQEVILESYKNFLKQCNFDFQIFIQTQRASAGKHIKSIQKSILYEPQIADIASDYIKLIKEISEVRGSIARRFYIIVSVDDNNKEARISHVVEGLKACGNIVEQCSKDDIFDILYKFLKKEQCYAKHCS